MNIVIEIPEKQYENLAKIASEGEEPLGYCERVVMRGTPQQTRWITVSERLPEESQYVLMTVRRMNERDNHIPFITTGYISWNQSAWWCAHDGDCKSNNIEVLAWMPLPDPYKAESEEMED